MTTLDEINRAKDIIRLMYYTKGIEILPDTNRAKLAILVSHEVLENDKLYRYLRTTIEGSGLYTTTAPWNRLGHTGYNIVAPDLVNWIPTNLVEEIGGKISGELNPIVYGSVSGATIAANTITANKISTTSISPTGYYYNSTTGKIEIIPS